MDPTSTVPVVGTPLAYGLGFVVLLLIVFTDSWARSLVTVAHEGGHMVLAMLTFRGHRGFTLADGGGGATELVRTHWSIGDLITRFAGYPAPSLLGLGGAVLVSRGRTELVVWVGLLLLLASFVVGANPLAKVVTIVAAVGVGWIAVEGSPVLRAAAGATLVWWMLIGGAYYASIGLSRGDGSDAHVLALRTLIPRVVWHIVWAMIGIACLWVGGRHLLRG